MNTFSHGIRAWSKHQDSVVLVQAARQGVVEGATHHLGCQGVGRTADELDARRVHRGNEHWPERLVLDGEDASAADVGNKVVVRKRRAGGDHFGAADDQPGVRLFLHMHVDIGDVVRRALTVHRGMG